jgi:predicted kinase
MKKFAFALVGAASIALAGCGGSGDDTLAENVQENMEGQAENLDALAGNAATDAEAEALGNQAAQLRNEGDQAEEAIDEADVTNAAEADQAVNGM